MKELTPCAECGMPCEPGEYHPFGACLMYRACHDSTLVRESIKAMRAAPVAAQAPEGWKPIATAPRDGSTILLRFGIDGTSQGRYVYSHDRPQHPWEFIDDQGAAWIVNHAIDGLGGPSHWAPLIAAVPQAPVADAARADWRELCRRLYVELFHCDKQMCSTLNEEGEPMWTQGETVRDALRDAKSALEAAPAQQAVTLTDAARDEPVNLEGLRKKLLNPRNILRDEDGWLTHSDFPVCDEGTRADKFLEAFGIETTFVGMESDSPDFAERWHEEGLTDCSEWTPTPPDGDGWLLLEIYDTEDGPYAMFGRDLYEAERARKREHTRRLSAEIRARREAAALQSHSEDDQRG